MIRFLWNPSVYIKMLEDYLHDKSMNGYHLDDCWYFFAKFKKGVPKDYEYFIAYVKTEEDKAKNKVLYDKDNNGFEYVCTMYFDFFVKVKDLIIFRKEADKVTESDIALKREQYKKCAKLNKLSLVAAPVLLIAVLVCWLTFYSEYLYEMINFSALVVYFTVEAAFSFYEHRKFSKEYTSIEQRYPKGKLRLIRFLSAAIAIVYFILCWVVDPFIAQTLQTLN